MFKKLRKLANDNKGSEVVEKILMVVTSIIIAGLGIGYLYSVINEAIKDANGQQGVMNNQNTRPDGQGTTQSTTKPTP